MLDEKVGTLLNAQINKELYSAYLYMSFANYFALKGLSGFSHWYDVQTQEERDHALLFRQYLLNNNWPIILSAIDMPENTFADITEPLEAGLAHEEYVTDLINTIYGAATTAKDYRTMQFLDWFIKEQGEEEENARGLIDKMKLFGADSKGLYLLDQEYAARIYAPPSLVL
jgi:ferritin